MISLTSPVRIWAHDLPAGLKLAALSAATPGLFFVRDPALMAAALAAVLALYASAGGTFLRAGARRVRALWPILAMVALWHVWIGEAAAGAVLAMRLTAAVALANFVTMTTRLMDMVDAVHVLTRPLARLGLRPRALDLAIALTVRMVPALTQKGAGLVEAWRARSPRRAGWRIVLPLTVLALDDADRVAEALRARGGVEDLKED